MSREKGEKDRKGRLTVAAIERELLTASLVGSFFHSDAENGWQGCVVAEPSRGVFLVELFSWATGFTTEQRLVRLEAMSEWRFYDDVQWMSDSYEISVERRWQRERSVIGDAAA